MRTCRCVSFNTIDEHRVLQPRNNTMNYIDTMAGTVEGVAIFGKLHIPKAITKLDLKLLNTRKLEKLTSTFTNIKRSGKMDETMTYKISQRII